MRKKNKITVSVPIPKIILKALVTKYGTDTVAYGKALTIVKELILKHQKTFAPMLHYFPYDRGLKSKITGASAYYCLWGELEVEGILEVRKHPGNRTYSYASGRCKYYRISPNFMDQEVEFLPLAENNKCSNKSTRGICTKVSDKMKLLDIASTSDEVICDAEEYASDYVLNKFRPLKNGSIKYRYKKKWYRESLPPPILKEYLAFEKNLAGESFKLSLSLIEQQKFYISQSDSNNRIDYNLTNCPSEILKSLEMDGESICEVDLSCSQPLILAHLLQAVDAGTKPILRDRFLESSLKHHLPPLLCSSNKGEVSDIYVFIEMAQFGRLYEYYSFKLHGMCTDKTRSEAKQGFIAALYSKVNVPNKNRDKFRKVFPNLVELLNHLKEDMINYFDLHFTQGKYQSLGKYTYSNNKGHKDAVDAGNDYLPVRMQQMESKLFIKGILPKLYKEGLIVLPRHDSILCKSSDLALIKNLMKEQLNTELGKERYHLKSSSIESKSKKVELLPEHFVKKAWGYEYRQIVRSNTTAVYAQIDIDSQKTIAYEVFRIKIREGKYDDHIKKEVPTREKYPPSSAWGDYAWTIVKLESALSAFLELSLLGKRLNKKDDKNLQMRWIISCLLPDLSYQLNTIEPHCLGSITQCKNEPEMKAQVLLTNKFN